MHTSITYMNKTMQSENLIGPDRVMDVRPIPCSVKHGLIIQTWLDLPVGGHFILLNDHDPVPLYYQFSAQWPGAFTWEHLVKGPDEFRVKITKLKTLEEAGCRNGIGLRLPPLSVVAAKEVPMPDPTVNQYYTRTTNISTPCCAPLPKA